MRAHYRFFDLEFASDIFYYLLNFDVSGKSCHLIMQNLGYNEWEMVDREEQGRYQDYELQFVHAIVAQSIVSTDND